MSSFPVSGPGSRSRALRAAVSSAVESLEPRRLFSYSQVGVIDNAFNESFGTVDVAFDTGIVGTSEVALIGKPADSIGSARLVTRTGVELLPIPNPDPDNVSNFGYDVAIAGDRLAIAATNISSGDSIVYIYDSAGGTFDANHDRVISSPSAAPDFLSQVVAYGDDLLVRGSNAAYVFETSVAAVTPTVTFNAASNSGGNAVATNGTNVLVATEIDGNTIVREFAPSDPITQTREFQLAGVHSVTLAYGAAGVVFIGDVNGAIVNQYGAAGTVPLFTYDAPVDTDGFARSLAVSGDYLLVGQVFNLLDGTISANVYDHTAGTLDSTIDAPAGSSAYFALTATAPIANGFAIGDALANDMSGAIYIYERDPETPVGPTAVLTDGNLTVTGTGNGEEIIVKSDGSGLIVLVDGVQVGGSFAVTGEVVIHAGAGDDIIRSDGSNPFPTRIYGGDGNDQITGGGGEDLLFGEAGNDVIIANQGNDVAVGGEGNDELFGGNGRDVLIGGDGSDTIQGNNGEDVLVAGFTVHDADPDALVAIRATWISGATYSDRVSSLGSGSGLLSSSSLSDDGVADLLAGGNGQDWFVVIGDLDSVGSTKTNETVS